MPLKTAEMVEEPKLDLTSMIDIVFLLIIFFMVGTQFTARERQYDIQLPTVSNAQALTSLPDELIVNITNDGSIQLGEQQKTLNELEDDLIAARRNYPDQAVIIRGDGTGPYQNVMNVLAVCHRAEITRISLANQLRQKDE